ncbi:MAG TPA: septum formation initiator family protein [Actinomycetota bacterium]|nr:septum formation initiator family protein [Actinomycetota bacterium]
MSSAVPSPTAATRSASRDASAAHRSGARRETSWRRENGRHELARGGISHPRLTARAAVLAVVSLILLTLAVAPLRTLIDQRDTLGQLERQADDLGRRNARLEARIDQLNDPGYLERLARECLGMVRPGETAFVMVPKHGPPPANRC